MSTPQVGQIWKECDPRFNRYVRIVHLHTNGCTIRTVTENGSMEFGKSTHALLRRFNGKRGGYILHKEKDQLAAIHR